MKTLLVWLMLSSAGFADIQVTLHVVEMPQALAAKLQGESTGDHELFQSARSLVKAGEAKLFETAVLRVKSGEKSVVESIHEHISPTEPEPPEGGMLGPRPPAPVQKYVPQIRLPSVPASFETRNVGATLEAEPIATGEGKVSIALAWDFVLYAGDTISDDWTDSYGNRHQIRRPVYVSQRAKTGLDLVSGRWVLVSLHSGSDPSGKIDPSKKLLVFARAEDLHPQK